MTHIEIYCNCNQYKLKTVFQVKRPSMHICTQWTDIWFNWVTIFITRATKFRLTIEKWFHSIKLWMHANEYYNHCMYLTFISQWMRAPVVWINGVTYLLQFTALIACDVEYILLEILQNKRKIFNFLVIWFDKEKSLDKSLIYYWFEVRPKAIIASNCVN